MTSNAKTKGVFPLKGVVLTGGRSQRMGADKSKINYRGLPHGEYCFELLSRHCDDVFYSVAADGEGSAFAGPVIKDVLSNVGPLAGIHAALSADKAVGWLVLACDLPFVDDAVIAALIAERDPEFLATTYVSSRDGLPEPLCTIYEPAMLSQINEFMAGGTLCPRKLLMNARVKQVKLTKDNALANANNPAERDNAQDALAQNVPTKQIKLRYFASLKDAAGKSFEELSTNAMTPDELYLQLKERYGFSIGQSLVKFAVNGTFVKPTATLKSGDEVVFIPPVAGG